MSKDTPFLLMQDGAPCHVSRKTMKFLKSRVRVIDKWPANSPDLNPIEMIWAIIKLAVKARKPKNLDEIEKYINEAWDSIEIETINKLVRSFRDRLLLMLHFGGKSISDIIRKGLEDQKIEFGLILSMDVEPYESWYTEIGEGEDIDYLPEVIPEIWLQWSFSKRIQYLEGMKNPNVHYYRNIGPGERVKMENLQLMRRNYFCNELRIAATNIQG